MKAAIGRVVQAGLQKYPDPMATAFRIAARRSCYGVDPDWILCGNGSDDILTIVTRAFVDPGDVVRFADPELHPLQHAGRDSGRASDVVELQCRLVARRRVRRSRSTG